MADTKPPPSPQPHHSKLVRVIAIVILTLIILLGLAVLVTWLVIKPKKLVYTIEHGSITLFNMSNNHLNATFNFELRAYNRNSKVSFYYDKIDLCVIYDDVTLATKKLSPFYQPHKNVTYLGNDFVARDVELFAAVARDFRLERASGAVELVIKMRARVKVKEGKWKSGHRKLKVSCSHILVNFSSHQKFQRRQCDVDL